MAKIIGYGTKLFSRVGNMALGVYEFSKNAYELYDRHKDPDFKWDKDTKGLAVNAAVSLGVAAVEAVGFARDIGNYNAVKYDVAAVEAVGFARDIGNYNAVKYDVATSQCFVAGTLVLTSEGNKPIEEIKSGDLVYSTDPETGESEYKEVVQTFENETEELVHISVAGEEIVTTPKHPFYTPHKGWTSAIDLRAGDILVLSNGEYVIVEKVQHEILESPIKVYNFEVQEFHTYYVGENPVLVHNRCKTIYDEKTNTVEVEVSKKQYGKAAEHIEFYINNSENINQFTISRGENGANIIANRKKSLAGYSTMRGFDRDECPMALFSEGGSNASIWYIDPHSNRSLGSAIGRALKPYADGTIVTFKIVD